MKRKFELMVYANPAGYTVMLKIDGHAFEAQAETAKGETVGGAYKGFVRSLKEVYSDLDTNLEYADIRDARGQVYAIVCALNKICKGGAQ